MKKDLIIDLPADFLQRLNIQKLIDLFGQKGWIYSLMVVGSFFIGLSVIISTHYADNMKLLIGIVGGLAFIILTMKWPELSILSLVALMSGFISLTWLPLLRLGPISLNISDIILIILLGLVFVRVTALRGYQLFNSPLILPLILFLITVIISAGNALLLQGVGFNTVFRTVRNLSLWLIFFPTLELIRDEKSLKRTLLGLLIFTIILLVGVIFPNKFQPFLPIEERAAGTGATLYSGFNRVYFAGDMILYTMIPVVVASIALIKKGNPVWKIVLLGLLFFWAFKTLFRQYWLTLFIVCALIFLIVSSRERIRLIKRLLPVALAGFIIFYGVITIQPSRINQFVYIFSDRVSSLLQNPFKRESSLHWRIIETNYALRQINKYPLLGIGLANKYRPPMEAEAGTMYDVWTNRYMENGYLYIATFMGIISLVFFLWLCIAFLIRVIRNFQKIEDEYLKSVFLGFGFAFLGMMACNVTTPVFVFGTRLVFFPFLMAVNEVIIRTSVQNKPNKIG